MNEGKAIWSCPVDTKLWDKIKNASITVQNAQNNSIDENRFNGIFNVVDRVMVKRNRRLGNKFTIAEDPFWLTVYGLGFE